MALYVATGYWEAGYAEGETASGYEITVTPGSVTVAGQNVGLSHSRSISVSTAAVSVTGQNIGLSAGRNISVTPASVTISPGDIDLSVSRSISVDPASVTVTGLDIELSTAKSITVEPATVTITGGNIELVYSPSVEPEEETRAPGGGYAPWEYKRLDRIRDEMEVERIAKDKATLDELSEAYDRVNGLLEEATQEAKAVDRSAVAQAMMPASKEYEAQDFSALIAELIQLKQEIERDIADEDEAVSLLLMVA